MTDLVNTIIDQALELSASERAEVADRLLASIDQPNAEMDRIWLDEAEARLDAYERGEIKAIPASEVLGKYDKK